MSEVGVWDPGARPGADAGTKLGQVHVKALDDAAGAAPATTTTLTVDASVADKLREVMLATDDQRESILANQPSARLLGWLRVLTLAEMCVPGCEIGAKSPVIPLARELRSRSDYPDDLTAWIKRASTNRFLPYGSLADRLRG